MNGLYCAGCTVDKQEVKLHIEKILMTVSQNGVMYGINVPKYVLVFKLLQLKSEKELQSILQNGMDAFNTLLEPVKINCLLQCEVKVLYKY